MNFPKRQNSEGGPANFLKIKDGESVTGILAGELYQFRQKGFGVTAQVVGIGEGGKERFRHNLIVKEDGKLVAKIWEFGPKIYDELSALEAADWDLKKTSITISRAGSTKENTKNTVTPSKKEPSASTIKEVAAIELQPLEHKQSSPKDLTNYAPGADDGEMSF